MGDPRIFADQSPGAEVLPSCERDVLLQEHLTRGVIGGAFYRVYNTLGFGFLESVYANALTHEMTKRGLRVEREVPVRVWYDGHPVGTFRVDVLVEGAVVVEIKAARALGPTDPQQVLNYLRGTNLEVGLLLHFGPKPSFKRFVSSNTSRAATQ